MTAFRWLTAGESHGKGLAMIVEGVPAGLALTEDRIAADLATNRSKVLGGGDDVQLALRPCGNACEQRRARKHGHEPRVSHKSLSTTDYRLPTTD